jgi:CO/xanthine dehydrogenase FAD-binding subunit
MTRTATVERDAPIAASLPLLAEAAARVGHVAVRNRGTVGGNVAHADPAANLPPVMLVLDAEFTVRSENGERTVAAAMRGREPSTETWSAAAEAAARALNPPADVHASSEYRRHLAGALVRRALAVAGARAEGR